MTGEYAAPGMDAPGTPSPRERKGALLRKLVFGALGLLLLFTSGTSFYRHRNLAEPVVLGPGVTAVKRLSDY
ncbi:MAG: hypothetical protein ACWGSQ_03530, partial [Longimicrobiales bacterium]